MYLCIVYFVYAISKWSTILKILLHLLLSFGFIGSAGAAATDIVHLVSIYASLNQINLTLALIV